MADIKLKNGAGVEQTYSNINKINVPSATEGTVDFIIPSGNKEITSTAQVDVSNYSTATVSDANLISANIVAGKTILGVAGSHIEPSSYTGVYQITPASTEQVFSTNGKVMTSDLTINAMPSMTLPTAAASTSTGTSKATISTSTSTQYINIPTGYNATASYYTINAPTAMTLPTSTSSSSSGTAKAVISVSTATRYINIPAGYNATAAYYKLNPDTAMTLPTSTSSTSSGSTKKLTITPSTSAKYINIPTGHNSTSAYYQILGDTNLVASNIKSGTSIFGVTGTYSGDGGSSSAAFSNATYAAASSPNVSKMSFEYVCKNGTAMDAPTDQSGVDSMEVFSALCPCTIYAKILNDVVKLEYLFLMPVGSSLYVGGLYKQSSSMTGYAYYVFGYYDLYSMPNSPADMYFKSTKSYSPETYSPFSYIMNEPLLGIDCTISDPTFVALLDDINYVFSSDEIDRGSSGSAAVMLRGWYYLKVPEEYRMYVVDGGSVNDDVYARYMGPDTPTTFDPMNFDCYCTLNENAVNGISSNSFAYYPWTYGYMLYKSDSATSDTGYSYEANVGEVMWVSSSAYSMLSGTVI